MPKKCFLQLGPNAKSGEAGHPQPNKCSIPWAWRWSPWPSPTSGGVPLLVTLLHSGTEQEQGETAFLLGLLAENPHNLPAISAAGAIPALIHLAAFAGGAVHSEANGALRVIACNSTEAADDATNAALSQAIEYLVGLLHTDDGTAPRRNPVPSVCVGGAPVLKPPPCDR